MMDPKASATYQASLTKVSDIQQIDLIINHLEKRFDLEQISNLLEELDSILGSLYAVYIHELDFLADDDPQNAAANIIAKKFSDVRPALNTLLNQLKEEQLDEALESAYRLRQVISELFTSFGDLKQQSLQGPHFSKLPYTQELIRVVEHYLNGKLPLSSALARMEAFYEYHENLEASLKQMIPTAAEAQVFAQRQEDIEEALAIQLQGFEELDSAIEQQNPTEIRAACEALKTASDLLFEIYTDLQQAELGPSPLTATCIHCGAENLADSRQCGACGALLPKFSADTTYSKFEIREYSSAEEQQSAAELIRLKSSADKTLSSQNPKFLEDALLSFEKRLRLAQRRLATLQNPPKDIPSEHREILSKGRETFQKAVHSLTEGHNILQDGAKTVDAELISCGLEEIEAGFSSLQEFATYFSQAQAIAPS